MVAMLTSADSSRAALVHLFTGEIRHFGVEENNIQYVLD